MGQQWLTLFFWAPKSLQMVIAAMKLKDTFWKESYDQPRQHIQKQRHYFVHKGRLVKAMVFPVVMYGCESWTVKKAERQRTDAFELWCCRRLLRVFGLQGDHSSQYSRKSVLNIHWKDWCWSWNSNTLATWCKELTHWERPWCWERVKASPIRWTWVWVNSRSSWWSGKPGVLQSMGLEIVGYDWATILNWTCPTSLSYYPLCH